MKTKLFKFKLTKKSEIVKYPDFDKAYENAELITKEDYLYDPFFRTLTEDQLTSLIVSGDLDVYNDLNGEYSDDKAKLLIDYYDNTKRINLKIKK